MTPVKLSGRALRALSPSASAPFLGRITERTELSEAARAQEILLLREPPPRPLPAGFRGYLSFHTGPFDDLPDAYWLASDFRYLEEGDVVRIDPARRSIATLYRRRSKANTFLVTERCDNYCIMCSQPPRERDDGWLVDELLEALPLISDETEEVGITGGEPALLGHRLLDLMGAIHHYLPRTAVHVLSNGRRFAVADFARALGDLRHPDLVVGVPLYSDLPEIHDFVVQARGAFDETLRGVLNLKRARVRVELRLVIHRETYARLPRFAEFVARNLVFADHVALMGLELMGFARANLDALWIDPLDYQAQLIGAVRILDRARIPVSVYNHQLCVLAPELHPFARRSISDWKNMYLDRCAGCSSKADCGGFFASSTLRVSRGISAIVPASPQGASSIHEGAYVVGST